MANYTTNLSLKKPVDAEGFDIADFNGNADKIDAAFGAGYGQSSTPSVSECLGYYTETDGKLKRIAAMDLNDISKSGRIYVPDNCTNLPSGSTGGYLDSYIYSSSYKKQVFYPYGDQKIFVRTNNNGTWSSWKELADADDVKYLRRDNGYSLNLASGDADALTSNGRWYLFSAVLNKPVNNGGYIDVICYDSSWLTQVFYAEGTNDMFTRRKRGNGNWTSWEQIVFNSKLKTGTFRIVVDTANVNKQITSSTITTGTMPDGDNTNTWFVVVNTGTTRTNLTCIYYDGGDLLITSNVAQAYYVRWFSWT